MTLITPLENIGRLEHPAIFLAGSVETGKTIKWQDYVAEKLQNFDVAILDPRRESGKFNWNASIKNKKFKEQLTWEFNALSKSNYIILNFSAESKSPVSLLELGLFARYHKIFCCCAPKYWRHGNVEFVCDHFQIPLYHDLDEVLKEVKKILS